MTLKECYTILQLTQDASLDDIKRAYRKRAFELHPDLHPNLPTANQNFQLLNEAYVILTKLLAAKEQFKEGKTHSKTGKSSTKKQTTQGNTDKQKTSTYKKDTTKSKETEKPQTTQQQNTNTHTGKTTTHQTRPNNTVYTEQHEVVQDILTDPFARRVFEDIYSEIRKKTHSATTSTEQQPSTNQQPHSSQQESTKQQPNAKQQESTKQQSNANQQTSTKQQENTKQQPNANQQTSTKQQESNNQQTQTPQAKAEPTGSDATTQPAFQWPFSLTWKPKHRRQNASKGFQHTVKDWLLQQIDEEQIFVIPAKRLFPGARIRLQIRQAFSDSPTTIDVTLPADFSPTIPIRLKGMGKKIGKWQGDLYLTLKPQP